MKLQFYRRIFGKYSNIKFHKNPFRRNELFHADRRTDSQADMTKLFAICEYT